MYIAPSLSYPKALNQKGLSADMDSLCDDKWLMETEVHYFIRNWRNMFRVDIVFVHIHNPMKLLCRIIDTYASRKKAMTYASIFQRGIRKDARGTLKANYERLYICNN